MEKQSQQQQVQSVGRQRLAVDLSLKNHEFTVSVCITLYYLSCSFGFIHLYSLMFCIYYSLMFCINSCFV